METLHVLPIDDVSPHSESGEVCACGPRVEVHPNGNKVIVHNAYDGREFFETDEVIEGH